LHALDGVSHAFSPGDLDTYILEHDYLVCFEFNVSGGHDEFLEQLQDFERIRSGICKKVISGQLWHKSSRVKKYIETQIGKFKRFLDKKKSFPNVNFLITHDLKEENEGATIWVYDKNGDREIFDPPGKCSRPRLINKSHNSLKVEWNKPEDGTSRIESYTVYYRENTKFSSKWMKQNTDGAYASIEIDQLKPATFYHFKVCANWKLDFSEESDISEDFETSPSATQSLKSLSICVHSGNPSVYQLPLTVMCKSIDNIQSGQSIKLARYVVGQPLKHHTTNSEKVLMVVGATGTGKTLLINAMVNYLLGVNYGDNIRFKLISEDQKYYQTNSITSYTIHPMDGFRFPHILTIVDTPGFGGMERDEQITKEMQKFISDPITYGVHYLNGILFVAQASIPRLTPKMHYIFNSVLSLFGNDMEAKIFVMVTFANGQRPAVLDVFEEATIKCSPFYKFNNSALYSSFNGDKDSFDEMFWKMGEISHEKFFKNLISSEGMSLLLTREVLDTRKQMHALISVLRKKLEEAFTFIKLVYGGAQEIKMKMKEVEKHLIKLGEIALRTHPDEYLFENLIESEKQMRTPGYMERILFYQEALLDAQIVSIAKGSKRNSDMYANYMRAIRYLNA